MAGRLKKNWTGMNEANDLPVQIFLSHPVVLGSICYRTRAKRLRNESNTIGGMKKIMTGFSCVNLYLGSMPNLSGITLSKPNSDHGNMHSPISVQCFFF